MGVALYDRDQLATDLDPDAVTQAVEGAFRAQAHGRTVMPAKSYVHLERHNGDFRSMPAYVHTDEWEAAGVKWVNVHPDNPASHNLPTVMGIMIYSDPATARPLAIMDGTELTRQRTAAAAAVATDHLAVPDAETLGIIGLGAQAVPHVRYLASVRPISRIVASDVDESAVATFRETFEDRFTVEAGDPATCARCDILSTMTPVRSPIVDGAALGERTHVNAIGADAPGKQELDPRILREGYLVVDDIEQSTHSGEVNVGLAAGELSESDIDATLSEVVIGEQPGREAGTGVTVFDSTGLAIQDVAAAHVVFDTCTATTEFDFLGLDP